MHKTTVYEQWLAKKRTMDVPLAFADRVMTTLHRETQRQPSSPWGLWMFAPWAQASLAFGALLVFVLRFVTLFSAAVG